MNYVICFPFKSDLSPFECYPAVLINPAMKNQKKNKKTFDHKNVIENHFLISKNIIEINQMQT